MINPAENSPAFLFFFVFFPRMHPVVELVTTNVPGSKNFSEFELGKKKTFLCGGHPSRTAREHEYRQSDKGWLQLVRTGMTQSQQLKTSSRNPGGGRDGMNFVTANRPEKAVEIICGDYKVRKKNMC